MFFFETLFRVRDSFFFLKKNKREHITWNLKHLPCPFPPWHWSLCWKACQANTQQLCVCGTQQRLSWELWVASIQPFNSQWDETGQRVFHLPRATAARNTWASCCFFYSLFFIVSWLFLYSWGKKDVMSVHFVGGATGRKCRLNLELLATF